MASLAFINIKFTADLKQFSTEMQTVLRDLKSVGKDMQNIGSALSVGVTLPILAAGSASVKMASDFEESLNKVDVSFGNSSTSIRDFAKTTLETYGIAEGTALDMAALFGDMATSMGLPQSEAANLSKSLVGLAGDLASFKNIGIDQATTALNGVFTGETESLKMLGIVMTEVNLQQFALSKGIQKSLKDFSQAEKVQLRYAYVMEQTKNAQGDFARTSGGSANQTRILQERFKELGQQFGSIILPAFTRLVTSLNAILKSFSELSPSVKNTIVVVAGLAAAIGPLLFGIGTILTLIPSMVAGFASVKAALVSFTSFVAANPFGVIAVGIGLAVAALYSYSQANKEVVKTKTALERVNESANESLLKERVELEKLVAIAKDETKSKEERNKAIKQLNELSPKYLGNITTETINTDKAKIAIENYTQALLQKYRVEAAEAELKELANKRFKLELGQLQAKEKLVKAELKLRSDATALEKQGFEQLKKAVQDGGKLIQNYYAEEEKLLRSVIEGTDTFNAKKNEGNGITDQTREKVQALDELTQSTSANTIAALEAQIAKLKQLREEFAVAPEQIKLIDNAIKALQTEITLKVDPTSLIQAPVLLQKVATSADLLKVKMQALNESLSESFTQIYESAYENLAVGFGEAIAQMVNGASAGNAIGKLMLTTIGELMVQLGKAAIEIGITMSTIKQSFKSPLAAIAAGVALIAAGTLIKSAIPNDFEKFADGGVVGGSSFYGDKILARVNSGELILNTKQQRALDGMLNTAPVAASKVDINVKDILLEGSKIRIVLDRADHISNRQR